MEQQGVVFVVTTSPYKSSADALIPRAQCELQISDADFDTSDAALAFWCQIVDS